MVKKYWAALLGAALLALPTLAWAAPDSEEPVEYEEVQVCVFNFDQPLDEPARLRCGDYITLVFDGNYGTDKENLSYSTDVIPQIARLLEDDDVDYYTFIAAPKFATPVTVAIQADPNSFLYEYKDGEMRAVEASYENDAWTFQTKKFGAYFITEEEYPAGPVD